MVKLESNSWFVSSIKLLKKYKESLTAEAVACIEGFITANIDTKIKINNIIAIKYILQFARINFILTSKAYLVMVSYNIILTHKK